MFSECLLHYFSVMCVTLHLNDHVHHLYTSYGQIIYIELWFINLFSILPPVLLWWISAKRLDFD